MPGLPDVILTASLARRSDTWLEVACCGTSYHPLRMLARRYGGQHRVGEVVDRLRCQRCHGQPAGREPGRQRAGAGWRGAGGGEWCWPSGRDDVTRPGADAGADTTRAALGRLPRCAAGGVPLNQIAARLTMLAVSCNRCGGAASGSAARTPRHGQPRPVAGRCADSRGQGQARPGRPPAGPAWGPLATARYHDAGLAADQAPLGRAPPSASARRCGSRSRPPLASAERSAARSPRRRWRGATTSVECRFQGWRYPGPGR